jgi:hypothetical protein
MNDAQKIQALKALLEDEALANEVLGRAQNTEKQADAMGISFKEVSEVELAAMTPDQLLEYAVARKEAEIETAQKAEAKEDDEEEEEADDTPPWAKKMMAEMKAMAGSREKEAVVVNNQLVKDDTTQALKEVADAHTGRIAALETTVKELSAEIAVLKGEQPKAIAEGVRPTQASNNVVEQEATKEAETLEAALNGATGNSFAGWLMHNAPGLQ